MDLILRRTLEDSSCLEDPLVQEGIGRCPFLRNINQPTNFSFSSVNFPTPMRGAKGPIFEDGPNFDMSFRLFHGRDGVVPLSGRSYVHTESPMPNPEPAFNPLAAKAATISLSAFGLGGLFGFDPFKNNRKKQNKKSPNHDPSSQKSGDAKHEAPSDDWLKNGQCPIAKSYRAMSGVLPLVASVLKPPAGLKIRCPQAIVAARAALARTSFVKDLRPQPLPEKILAIALLGMAVNVPLGIWREHTQKFSIQWIAAVHASVPFIAMLRKSVLMPKYAMAFTIAASILGQTIGSRAERIRLKKLEAGRAETEASDNAPASIPKKTSNCGEEMVLEPLPFKMDSAAGAAAIVPATRVCY